MSTVYFWSDLHLGHTNIHKFRTQFKDEQDHFEYIKATWHRGEPLAEVQRRVTLGGPTTVEIGLQSYHTERLIGAGAFALGVLSMVTGLIWAIVGSGEEGGNIPPIAIGVSGLGLTVGGAMMVFGLFAHDEVTFDVRPQAPSN